MAVVLLALGCAGEEADGGAPSGGSPVGGSAGGVVAGGSSSGGDSTTEPNLGGAASEAAKGGSSEANDATGGSDGTLGGAGGDAQDDALAGSGGADGGGDGSPASDACAAPGLLFCDDFEEAPSSWPEGTDWALQLTGSGVVELDQSSPAASGNTSIHVRTADSDYQTFFVYQGGALPVAARRFYVRVMLRLASPMTDGHNTYFKAGYYPDGCCTDPYETRIGVHQSMLDINQQEADRGYLSNNNFWTDGVIGPGLQAETWGCVEVLLDHASTEIAVWIDGTEVPDLHHLDWQQDDYDTLSFGFEQYAGPGTELWYDDVALGTERIGCPQP